MKTNDGRFFPDTLVRLPIWILWKSEPGQNGRLTKVPYSARYDGRASSSNPNTWTTFDKAWRKFVRSGGVYAGVGICLQKSDNILFIDVDHCVDDDCVMNETAADILDHMGDQFIELSQSGSGLHIICMGTIPKSFKNSGNGVEMYNDRRFIAMTGYAVNKGEPHEDSEAVRYVYETYKIPDKPVRPIERDALQHERDDQWIIDHAMQRGKFPKLYSGKWASLYGSQSEADLALCNILAFWCDCNPDQIDRIFRSSELYRKKWERDDYRNRTITTAIENCGQTLSEYIKKEDAEFERAFFEEW